MVIITGSFKTGYENISNKELISKLNAHSGTTAQDSIKSELTRRLIDEINNFNKESAKYSKVIIWLTIILGVLAFIQLIILLI